MDRIFDAISLRLSAYALHDTSYRIVPSGTECAIHYPGFYLNRFSTHRPIGPEPGRYRRFEILGGVIP